MKHGLKRRASWFLIVLLLCARTAWADGGLVIYDPAEKLWRLQTMNEQLCAINYEEGRENMLLSIYMNDLKGEKALWIFPVPASPGGIQVDMFRKFPSFWGRGVEEVMEDAVGKSFVMMGAVEMFPAAFIMRYYMPRVCGYVKSGDDASGVEIHRHVEKFGVTADLVTARDAGGLYAYAGEKGLDLPDDLEERLDAYIGEDYTFCLTWISDLEAFAEETRQESAWQDPFNSLSVFLSFPAERIFFPMRLTGVYGGTPIPMTVYVLGFVAPEVYPEIANDVRTRYEIGDRLFMPEELRPFLNGRESVEDAHYSVIKINTASRNLTEDLWIDRTAHPKYNLALWISRHVLVWGVLLFLLLSCLLSMLAGILVFRKYRPSPKAFFLFGVWHALTITGLAVLARHKKIDTLFTHISQGTEPRWTLLKTTKVLVVVSLGLVGLGTLAVLLMEPSIAGNSWASLLGMFLIWLAAVFSVLSPFFYIFTGPGPIRDYLLVFMGLYLVSLVAVPNLFLWIYGLF